MIDYIYFIIKTLEHMANEEKTKLYFLIKEYLMEDFRKSDIKEIAISRFPEMTDTEFNEQFSDAFCNL